MLDILQVFPQIFGAGAGIQGSDRIPNYWEMLLLLALSVVLVLSFGYFSRFWSLPK
jgi:hypothetical protein